MPSPSSFTIELPAPPHCIAEGCAETKLKGRGLCARHYGAEWASGNHVFRPKRPQDAIFQVRCFLYEADLKAVDALALERGLSRSELIREVMHALATQYEG